MKKYEKPQMEVIKITNDVIVTSEVSSCGGTFGYGGGSGSCTTYQPGCR